LNKYFSTYYISRFYTITGITVSLIHYWHFIGPMHEENILGNTPLTPIAPSENQYFSTFQIPLEPCCQLFEK